jgi:regulator of sigma E protease
LASLAGMVVLVALMLVAFKNDVERRWDVIVTQVRELMS